MADQVVGVISAQEAIYPPSPEVIARARIKDREALPRRAR